MALKSAWQFWDSQHSWKSSCLHEAPPHHDTAASNMTVYSFAGSSLQVLADSDRCTWIVLWRKEAELQSWSNTQTRPDRHRFRSCTISEDPNKKRVKTQQNLRSVFCESRSWTNIFLMENSNKLLLQSLGSLGQNHPGSRDESAVFISEGTLLVLQWSADEDLHPFCLLL